MASQEDKAHAFAALHRDGTFIIPNPWDIGSARLLQGMGFAALATTSAGFALTLGRRDGQVSRDEKLVHCRALADATDIPISADLENGFGDTPEFVAETIRLAIDTGIVGASIEDYTNDAANPLYPASLAIERITAAVEAANRAPFPFLITARAEQMLRAARDLDATIERLIAFEDAGAHVVYAPGLRTLEEVGKVTGAVRGPVNVLVSPMPEATQGALAALGVRRVSIGGALATACIKPLLDAGTEMRSDGSFSWLAGMARGSDIRKFLTRD